MVVRLPTVPKFGFSVVPVVGAETVPVREKESVLDNPVGGRRVVFSEVVGFDAGFDEGITGVPEIMRVMGIPLCDVSIGDGVYR